MGEQFWWFYDVIALAVIFTCVFISARKGAMHAVSMLIAYVLAFGIAFSFSAALGGAIADNMITNSNTKKINTSLSGYKFTTKVAEYINTLDYGVNVEAKQLEEIYSGNKNYNEELLKYINNRKGKKVEEDPMRFEKRMNEGYSQMMRSIVGENLNKYSAEVAAKKVIDDPETFNELIPMMLNKDDKSEAAEYISENYVQEAYETISKLICFIIMFTLAFIALLMFFRSMLGNQYHEMRIPAHVGGALIGIPKGIILCFAVAAVIRLYVVLGSDEMLFFNFNAIDKTYIFKHMYNNVADMM